MAVLKHSTQDVPTTIVDTVLHRQSHLRPCRSHLQPNQPSQSHLTLRQTMTARHCQRMKLGLRSTIVECARPAAIRTDDPSLTSVMMHTRFSRMKCPPSVTIAAMSPRSWLRRHQQILSFKILIARKWRIL